MDRLLKYLVVSFLMLFLFAGGAWALELGLDITINDNRSRTDSTWYSGVNDARNGINEDNEVEPGMLSTQQWDLEAFYLDGFILSMVGGWDFLYGHPNYNFSSGDIFIDIDGDAKYGSSAIGNETSSMGYDYVFDINWGPNDLSYNVYSIDDKDYFRDSKYYNSPESDPWQFDNANGKDSLSSGHFDYNPYTYGQDGTFLGDNHYIVSGFNLDFLLFDEKFTGDFIAHFTMECGNDNLMGKGVAPVPEPATMLLLGTGLIGLAGASRKKFKK